MTCKESVKVKKIINDDLLSYVYYTLSGSVFGTYYKLNKELASIEDVRNHWEIWDCHMIVKEG